jgi:hypothetical protein
VRRRIVVQYLAESHVGSQDIDSLVRALTSLQAIPTSDKGAVVNLDEDRQIAIDLSYETSELTKDILFLSEGEAAFEEYLRQLHPTLDEQVEQGVAMLESGRFLNLITDRDGTVNNYCGRYLSSIQSTYNAVYIARFAEECVNNAVILTSAPLEQGGLVDITTIPDRTVINAGSKGREYRDLNGERGSFPIAPEQQAKLDELNRRRVELVKQPQHQKFGLIGSGLQQKFGQTTIARQDITSSVPEQESTEFFSSVQNLVQELDPAGQFFRIEDTGLDVEIILTVPSDESEAELTDFSKGNGVGFLNDRLGLDLATGPNLVCGDTGSDLPMLEECLKHSARTWTVFVTPKDELKQRVRSLTEQSLLVDQPDTLVTILNRLAVG